MNTYRVETSNMKGHSAFGVLDEALDFVRDQVEMGFDCHITKIVPQKSQDGVEPWEQDDQDDPDPYGDKAKDRAMMRLGQAVLRNLLEG